MFYNIDQATYGRSNFYNIDYRSGADEFHSEVNGVPMPELSEQNWIKSSSSDKTENAFTIKYTNQKLALSLDLVPIAEVGTDANGSNLELINC